MNKKITYAFVLFFIIFMMLSFIRYPSLCIEGATNGLLLWFHKVLPSLLPFIILTNILASLGVVMTACRKISPLTQKLLGLSGSSLFVFTMGLIAGYPTGAKLTGQLLVQKQLSSTEAQKLLYFSNNCGPLFIIGTVGTLLLGSSKIGYFLFFIHILSALTLMFLYRFYIPTVNSTTTKRIPSCSPPPPTSLATLFNTSLQNAMDTIVYVGGYIIFFSVLVNFFKHARLLQTVTHTLSYLTGLDTTLLQSAFLGSLELSTGISSIAPLFQTVFSLSLLALIAGIIAFGGFCVYFQSLYFLQNTSLKTGLYLFSKLLQALFSGLYVYLFYPLFFNKTDKNFLFILPLKPFLLVIISFLLSVLLVKSLSRKAS